MVSPCRAFWVMAVVSPLVLIGLSLLNRGPPTPKQPWELRERPWDNRPESWTELLWKAGLGGLFFGGFGFILTCMLRIADWIDSNMSPEQKRKARLVRKYLDRFLGGVKDLCIRFCEWSAGEEGDIVWVDVQVPVYANAEKNPMLLSPYITVRKPMWVPRRCRS